MKQKITLLFLALILSCGMISATEEKTRTTHEADMSQAIYEELQAIRKIQDEAFKLQEIRQQEMDSVRRTQLGKGKTDIGLMAKIEDNTNERFMTGGLTLIAVIGLVFGFYTFWYQQKTERHTKNVSITSQLGVLKDLPRHFYRNLVCTIAMIWKYRHSNNKDGTFFITYPSEANVLKLKTLSREFILDIDVANDDVYKEMHEQKLQFKNYNLAVIVASEHFARKQITEKSLINDYDNLLYKPIALVSSMHKLQGMLEVYRKYQWWEENCPCLKKYLMKHGVFEVKPFDKGKFVCEVLYIFVKEHFNKLDFSRLTDEMQICTLEIFYQEMALKESITYDEKNGFERSLKKLMEIVDGQVPYAFIRKQEKDYYINRKEFVKYFFKLYKKELKRNEAVDIKDEIEKHKLNIIMKVGNANAMIQHYQLKGHVAAAIIPYFEFWYQDEWKVEELIYNLLMMDVAIELPIIGMIEH